MTPLLRTKQKKKNIGGNGTQMMRTDLTSEGMKRDSEE